MSHDTAHRWLQRYLVWRQPLEVLACVLFVASQAAFNTVTVAMDLQRARLPFQWWEVVTWEVSSHLMWLLLLPLVLWALNRWPLRWGLLRRHLPWHLGMAVVCSGVHVLGMVALRQFVYAVNGQRYQFGPWAVELLYEGQKDLRSYVFIAALFMGYRLLLWRWQGEARWLDAPDGAEPAPSNVSEAAPSAVLPSTEPAAALPSPGAPAVYPERLLVKKLGKEFLLPMADVAWVQACGNYVNLHRQQHAYPLRSTLSALEQRLDPQRFVRVHRSHLVNLDHLHTIEPTEAGDARLHLHDGSRVPCSRTHLEALRLRLATPCRGV
jgi:hypothetical protein